METIYHDLVFTQHGDDGYVLVPEPLAMGRLYWRAVIRGPMSLVLGMCPATHVWTPFTYYGAIQWGWEKVATETPGDRLTGWFHSLIEAGIAIDIRVAS